MKQGELPLASLSQHDVLDSFHDLAALLSSGKGRVSALAASSPFATPNLLAYSFPPE